jgi:DNA-binding response OmpR family regulator
VPTLLIVDDDKHTRALLERIVHKDLQKYALKVVQAGDGEEGLRMFDAEKPEFVVTDLLMPRMDGFRFCKAVRERDAHVNLVVISGVYRDPSISDRLSREFGASFYTKPYQIKDLVSALDRQLQASGYGSVDSVTIEADAPDEAPPPAPRAGKLEEASLAGLLLDLYEERATGVLQIRRGRIEKRIDLLLGHPVAVSSNQRHEMLGHFLVSRGAITEQQHQVALQRAHDEGEKVGEALIEQGAMSSADLVKHLTSQARYRITGALRWPDGTWTFRPQRDFSDRAKGNALDPLAVVFLGLRRTASIENAAKAIAPLTGRRVGFTARGRKLREAIARYVGASLAATIDLQPGIDELFMGRFEPALIIPAIEALLLTGAIEGLGEADLTARETKPDDPLSLGELSAPFRFPTPTAPHGQVALGEAAQPILRGGLADVAPPPDANIYDALFGEEVSIIEALPAAAPESLDGPVPEPLAPTDSSIIEIGSYAGGDNTPAQSERAQALREALLAEYLRIQGKDWYEVLDLSRTAGAAAVEQRFRERMQSFSLEEYAQHDIGRDYAKLEEVHSAYRAAGEVLGDPARRVVYDRELGAKRERPSVPMESELLFREGERRLSANLVPGAIEKFTRAVALAPDVADYQAALGWALHLADPRGPKSEHHLAQALAIDPDHAAAHEYLGRVLAEAQKDAIAADHLERALDPEPPRLDALPVLEEVRARRGEWALLERRYRQLLHRLQASSPTLALRLWLSLAEVNARHLHDRDAARTAYQCAQRLAPSDTAILDALAALAAGDPARWPERSDALRARWRLDPQGSGSGLELLRAALECDQHDAAFLAAACLEARGFVHDEAVVLYRRFRPRFLVRAQRVLDGELWKRARHREDEGEIGLVFAIVAKVAERHAPLGLAELGVGEPDLVAEDALPSPVARVRDYVSRMLGVPRVRCAVRGDFGAHAYLGASTPPLLLLGPDALATTDKVELAFRLGRAMTYLWPGRALGGSRPTDTLKELFTAAILLGDARAQIGGGRVGEAGRALQSLADDDKERLREAAARITDGRTSINLSRWARALARSADRVGMILCGDPAVAARLVRETSPTAAVDDLIDWATGPEHLEVRARLGVSVDV